MRYIYQGTWTDGLGNVVSGGTITVYEAGTTTLANVYVASSGGVAVNSVESGSSGEFSFWVDSADYTSTQKFKIILSKSGFSSQTYDNLIILPIMVFGISALSNSATPEITTTSKYWLTGGTITITNITNGETGQEITILSEHTITITDGTNIFLNGSANFVMNSTDSLSLVCKADGKWYEIGRSDNT